MAKGQIVAGCLAPHPPHLVYADNPPQNEAYSEGGWETLRWGYQRLARKLKNIDYDAIVIFTPHWQTYIGTHFLGLPEFKSKSDYPAKVDGIEYWVQVPNGPIACNPVTAPYSCDSSILE